MYKQHHSDTQNNEHSLHMIIGMSKTNTTQILWKDPSMLLPHITTITTTVEQRTTHIQICSSHNVLNKTYEGWNFNSGNYSYLFTTDTK
jgi:hypothetical protein